MKDDMYDDIKALLDGEFGDDRILSQILRAYENNEVISNFERNYVKQLAEKHLGKKSHDVKSTKTVAPDVVMPDDVMPKSTVKTTSPDVVMSKPIKSASFKSKFKILKRRKVLIGIVLVMLVGIIGSNISSLDIPVDFDDSPLSIRHDLNSYNTKDLISISGKSEIIGTVILLIENTDNQQVWTEEVLVKNDGTYSTLVIAGGPGWEKSGTFIIKADNGEHIIASTFSFVK